MTEKIDSALGATLESQSNESEKAAAEEKVGPGHPPRHTQWKKGGPSPNPRGRPRKDQSMRLDVAKAFEAALNKKIPVPRGEKTVLMTRLEIGFEQLLNQLAKGDRYARRDLMDYAERLGIDFLAQHKKAIEDTLGPSRQAILDSFLAHHSGMATVAAASPALAPPELLDDDPAEAEDTVAPRPPAVMDPKPEPPPIPGKKYPKPFSQMTPGARRAWYPEYYANGHDGERAKEQAKEQTEEKAREQAEVSAKDKQAAPLDQASRGRGVPPPGGFSVTTRKWS